MLVGGLMSGEFADINSIPIASVLFAELLENRNEIYRYLFARVSYC
jgi:hypothetical protein